MVNTIAQLGNAAAAQGVAGDRPPARRASHHPAPGVASRSAYA